MHHEVGEGHESGQNERDRAREQAEHDQRASDQLRRAGEQEQAMRHLVEAGKEGKAQQLSRAMLQEGQSEHDAEHRLNLCSPRSRYDGEIQFSLHSISKDPRRPRSTRLQGSEDLRDMIKVETRATGEQLARIAVADVDQYVRLEAPVGEELRVGLGSVETRHRTRIESYRPQRDDEIGDLQRSVLERAAGGELRISREPGLGV